MIQCNIRLLVRKSPIHQAAINFGTLRIIQLTVESFACPLRRGIKPGFFIVWHGLTNQVIGDTTAFQLTTNFQWAEQGGEYASEHTFCESL